MTIYVLFADDIKNLSSPKKYDDEFAVSYAVCLFTFIFELVANSWAKTDFIQWYPYPKWDGFFLSFFWWLDILAIFSLFPDIPFIGVPIGIYSMSGVTGGTYARIGRIVRLVRLVRLVRVYKVANEHRARIQHQEELMELVRIGALKREDVEKQQGLYNIRQSRLGDRLSESTTRRVIVMILLMIIIVPILLYSPPNDGPDFAMTMLHSFNADTTIPAQAKTAMIDQFITSFTDTYDDRYVDMLRAVPSYSPDPYVFYAANVANLRQHGRREILLQSAPNVVTEAIFSFVLLMRQQAQMSIITTIFIAIMLVGSALVFTNDAQQLVIAPIERMMNMVEGVAADPLKPLHFHHASGPTQTGEYEMRLLETTVEKITGLLRVGFGEAGAGIISANLSTKNSSAAINPLLPGLRIYAIFGFCDIHHFEDINRKLEGDVLMFVNQIAEIVHSK